MSTDLESVQVAWARQDKELATGGIPLAAFGIGLATCGLLMQGIGSALTSW